MRSLESGLTPKVEIVKDEIGKWHLLDRRVLLKNKWLELDENNYKLPNGKHLEGFYVVQQRHGVNIVALTEKLEVLMVRQYRPAVDEFVYDFPAGFVEEGDLSLLDRAKTELVEETGYQTEEWYYTGRINPAPHLLNKSEHCFLAVNVKKIAAQNLDNTEFITYELVQLPKVRQMIHDGVFNCSVCISSFFKALLTIENKD